MFDSSTQAPFGILYGNMFHLGNFDECMLVRTPIRTHMCMVRMRADVSAVPLPDTDPYDVDPEPYENVWKKVKVNIVFELRTEDQRR